jgi:hypothetical protein
MTPIEVAPLESRQFELLIKRSGVDPSAFLLKKFARLQTGGYKVRVVGRGAATAYECTTSTGWLAGFAADLERGLFGPRGFPPSSGAVAKLLREIEIELVERGLPGALQFLNQRVPHRFTAVYRLDDGVVMRNVAVVDKHRHLEPLDLKAVPLKDSFCQFVLRDGLFLTEQSGSDPRLSGHPYSGIVGSYIGVPISRAKGSLEGTLCHFDTESHSIPDDEYLLLERAAQLFPAFLTG